MSDYQRRLSHRVDLVCHDRAVPMEIEEATDIERDTDGDPQIRRTHLSVIGGEVAYEAEGDDVADALFELERKVGDAGYFRICHQCRFGCTHPIQGREWWCLHHAPEVADGIQANGKYRTEPLDEVQLVEVSPLDTCRRFERPIHPVGQRPGTPQRR